MADETLITPPSPAEERIKDLSDKVKNASTERDAEKARADSEAAKAAEVTRERDFYAAFSDTVTTHPAAKDHKDEIKAKVMAGYSTQDATFAVLGAAGKLGQPQVESRPIAGGSASISLPQNGGSKTVGEMTRDEKRAALFEAEKRGDIGLT